MTVLVEFKVRVPDPERFRATSKRFEPLMQEMGARNQRLFVNEDDPNMFTSLTEWDSHDAMHAASEKHGDKFNEEAGTAGLGWETNILREV